MLILTCFNIAKIHYLSAALAGVSLIEENVFIELNNKKSWAFSEHDPI